MATTLWVTEFGGVHRRNHTQCADGNAVLKTTEVPFATASSMTTTTSTYLVRLCADAACSVTFTGAAATASDLYLPGNVPEYFSVVPGTTISAITNA